MKPVLSTDVAFPPSSRKPVAGTTVYFFDLNALLKHAEDSRLAATDRLFSICERHVRSIAGGTPVLFVDNGFYLAVTSFGGPPAAGLAKFINDSLLMLLFGTETLNSNQDIAMYKKVEREDLPASVTMSMLSVQQSQHQKHDDPGDDSAEAGAPAAALYERLAQDGVFGDQGVELSFYPVHDLRRKVVSSLFCVPTFAGAEFGHQAFRAVNPSQLPYIDRAILTHSLSLAQRLAAAGIIVAVGAPVSFETLAWSKSREVYQWALRAADLSQNPQLILKIEDIPPGTPADRVAQVVACLRPFARHIFVHLPNNTIDFGMTGRIGASGLVLSLPRRAPLPEVLAASKWLSRAAIAQGAMSCIDHVESDEALAVVRSAGVRFAVGHVFGAETVRGTAPVDDVRDLLVRTEAATVAHLTPVS